MCTWLALCFPSFPFSLPLEFNPDSPVDLSPGEVVRYGVLVVGDIGDPVVGVDIVDAEEVETVDAEPDGLAEGMVMALAQIEEVGHADVGTAVGRGPEIRAQGVVRSREGQSVGIGQPQSHAPA